MTWYAFFKSLHVFFAIVWVGGAATLQVIAFRALKGDGRRQVDLAQDAEFVGTRIFVPSALLLLVFGSAAMVNADLTWGQNWVTFGLIVFAASFIVGTGFIGPESGRLAKLIDEKGPDAPEVAARIRRILMVSRVELVFLIGVVWNMVVKPVGQPGWFWGALAVMAVAAVAVVANYVRGAEQTPAAATDA
jgi:uncharacterized membrane protein